MPKKKKYTLQVCVRLNKEQISFLDEMVRQGEAEDISQAVRKCINMAREKK